ncbi:F5/8 type C domain-containing protein [Streptomyces sp. di188]|nr:F5/8 type C domain-containing protein [Streptomyces sp. di50b]SCD89513.1 F5/8 type C domain-containing protein [Streptomyces sp. di188]
MGAFPQSVRLDLGGTVRVDEVVLKLPAAWEARTQTLAVEGSTDGSSFTTLSASAAHRFDPDRANSVTLAFPARDVRHLRVRVTANAGWNAAQLSALEVYGEDGGGGPEQPPADGTDLARGKPVEASSTIHSFVAANVNDGRVDTYWESAGHPATLTVHLGAEADVTAVVVRLNPDAAWERRTQSIEILGRDRSSGTYATLTARADHTFDPAGNGNGVTIPVTGRVADVQLKFGHNSAGYGAQVAELEVRGTAAPNPDLTVTALDWTPDAPTETDPVTVRATVRNVGTARSTAATLNVSLEGTVAGSAPVPALAPGDSATVSVDAGTHARGAYTVSAVADPTDTVAEPDETNNSRTATDRLTVTQSPGPALEVTGIRTSPASPAVGAQVSFTVSVHNRGTSPAPAGSVTRLTVAGRTLDGATGAIAAGDTEEVTVSGTWTATAGPAVLTATADATGTLTETLGDELVVPRHRGRRARRVVQQVRQEPGHRHRARQPLPQQHRPTALARQRHRDLRRPRRHGREQPRVRHHELPRHHAGHRPRPHTVLRPDPDRRQRPVPHRRRLLERGPGVRRHHPVRPGDSPAWSSATPASTTRRTTASSSNPAAAPCRTCGSPTSPSASRTTAPASSPRAGPAAAPP